MDPLGIDELLRRRCKPCEGGVPSVGREQAQGYLKGLKGWKLAGDGKSIRADYLMKDFAAAIDLVGRIAAVAEAEDHHPDLHLTGYRKLAIELFTHAIGGLSENDFILAAKIEGLRKELKS